MGTTGGSGATKRGAIVFDIENVRCTWALQTPEQIRWILGQLPAALARYGIKIDAVIAAAVRMRTSWKSRPRRMQTQMIEDLFRAKNGDFCWYEGETADEAIIAEITSRLLSGRLPEAVVIVSGDADFAQIVEQLIASGHHVVVVSPYPSVGPNLRATGVMVASLSQIITTPPPKKASPSKKVRPVLKPPASAVLPPHKAKRQNRWDWKSKNK